MERIHEADLLVVERTYPGIRRLYEWARPTSFLDLLALYERCKGWPV